MNPVIPHFSSECLSMLNIKKLNGQITIFRFLKMKKLILLFKLMEKKRFNKYKI